MSMTGGNAETDLQAREIIGVEWMMWGAIGLIGVAVIGAIWTGVGYLASVIR